jgi:putative flavoprotein involved in K+ transport
MSNLRAHDETSRETTKWTERELVEPGEAFARIEGLRAKGATEETEARADEGARGRASSRSVVRERFDVIVVGAGQAGLSVGYHLKKRGLSFVILDGNERVGDTWRKRWDSLRLFTPARLDGLVGMKFPAPGGYFPTKDEMGDYLESYAARFELPVRCGIRVQKVARVGERYLVTAGGREMEADQVVVAMTNYQKPRVPAFAEELRPEIRQLHSSEYKSPAQLREGGVLVAGAGNSGAEIALDLPPGRKTWIAGRHTGHVPFDGESFLGKLIAFILLRLVFHRILTIQTPMGRKARPKILSQGGPLIRSKPSDYAARGIEQVPRIAGVKDGLPVLADGRVLDVANVVWCTGFHPGFSWIDMPIFDEETGDPRHEGGRVPEAPGLYFVGLHFLYSVSSPMIHGVGRDAKRIVKMIVDERRR